MAGFGDELEELGEIECTAFDQSATTERNALFTPPCICPRCRPPEFDATDRETRTPGTMWVQVDGRSVRHDVAPMELGDAGRSLLG